MDNKDQERKTNFGFQTVDKQDKSEKVKQVFDKVTDNYDLMNDLLSFGIHRLWKRAAVELAGIRSDSYILDLAGGTGDVVKLIAPKVNEKGELILSDINLKMLMAGRDRLIDQGINNFKTLQIDAEALPFKENTFDIVSMAFGLRNVTSIRKALHEAKRVLRPGGRFLCLEFSRPAIAFINPIYDAYSFKILPEIGHFVANDRHAYKYLVESIRKFPDQVNLEQQINSAGLEKSSYRNLSGGIAAIHSAWRL